MQQSHFLTQYTGTLREKVAQALTTQSMLQLDTQHQIFVLALPRCLGLRFNSVVFYYVFDAQQNLYCILSEITNTPWNERHVYVSMHVKPNGVKINLPKPYILTFTKTFMFHLSCR